MSHPWLSCGVTCGSDPDSRITIVTEPRPSGVTICSAGFNYEGAGAAPTTNPCGTNTTNLP